MQLYDLVRILPFQENLKEDASPEAPLRVYQGTEPLCSYWLYYSSIP